jgi:PHP family Zn ribbon phosphoesterase
MNRVDKLADRPDGYVPSNAIGYKNLIPLDEIIAQVKGVASTCVAVEREYLSYVARFGTEFDILIKASPEQLVRVLSRRLADGILRMRQGKATILPGFDGEYGKISLFESTTESSQTQGEQQLSLF